MVLYSGNASVLNFRNEGICASNIMGNLIITILATLFLFSCSTGLGVRKSQVMYFDSQFTGTFNNNAYEVNGRRYGSPTLLELFEIYNVKADSVSMFFNKSGELELTYTDSEGKFKK